MRIAFLLIALSLLFAGCNGATSTNPGGHTPEEISRAQRQGPPPAPQAAAPQPASTGSADGPQLYGQYCAPCHADGKSAPSLAGVFQRRELPSGTPANDARVKETIKLGRAMMPAFNGVLNDEQVNAIVAYLHTM
ncbi:MAG: c-type cytochrome [Terriglobales bacterium]